LPLECYKLNKLLNFISNSIAFSQCTYVIMSGLIFALSLVAGMDELP